MYKKRIIDEGLAVETHGRASLSALGKKTHGRASLRAMPAGKTRGGMFLLVGLIFLFGACEKDIAEGFGKGGKVEIFLSTNITNYHAGGDVTRNLGLREPESRTIYINDSIYLQTTLTPDEGEELRLNASFIDGQKLCFAAFLADGTPKGSEIYTYSDAAHKWIPDGDPLGVAPDNSTTYRFVAYSYFGSTDEPTLTGIDPSYDLVWGMSADTKIEDETEAERTVDIHMTHKFARVKVNVNSEGISGADITALSGVSIDGGQLAELTPFDGDISWSGTATQGVADPFTVKSEKERESGYRTVKPVAAGSLKVKVGSVKISTFAAAFSNQTAAFTPALAAGTSYTLMVSLKKCVWSRSNIYWDGGKLTFVTDPNDLSKQGYQGVFFKFGSLVGVSPAGNGNFSGATIVYKPNAIATGNYSSWSNIPYWDSEEDVGAPNISTLKGDICRYINSAYRLPKQGEFSTHNDAWGQDWVAVNSFGEFTSTDEYGTYDFILNNKAYAKNTSKGDVCLPSSGYYSSSHLRVVQVGGNTCYWGGWFGYISSSPKGGCIWGTPLHFYANQLDGREWGFPVRCIRN